MAEIDTTLTNPLTKLQTLRYLGKSDNELNIVYVTTMLREKPQRALGKR